MKPKPSKAFYALRCVDLYVKPGGFTYDVRQAKVYTTRSQAERDRVSGWKVVRISLDLATASL
jgi:hypothetical protein